MIVLEIPLSLVRLESFQIKGCVVLLSMLRTPKVMSISDHRFLWEKAQCRTYLRYLPAMGTELTNILRWTQFYNLSMGTIANFSTKNILQERRDIPTDRLLLNRRRLSFLAFTLYSPTVALVCAFSIWSKLSAKFRKHPILKVKYKYCYGIIVENFETTFRYHLLSRLSLLPQPSYLFLWTQLQSSSYTTVRNIQIPAIETTHFSCNSFRLCCSQVLTAITISLNLFYLIRFLPVASQSCLWQSERAFII